MAWGLPGTRARTTVDRAQAQALEVAQAVDGTTLALTADAAVSARLVEMIAGQRLATVSRSVAVGVPAFNRGLQLIAGTVAGFGLAEYAPDGSLLPTRPVLDRPDPWSTRFNTVQALVDDLVCYGCGYWKVAAVSGESGYTYPTAIEPVPASKVSPVNDAGSTRSRYVNVDGVRHRLSDPTAPGCLPGELIEFRHGYAALTNGASTIALAAALEATVAGYAAAPLPQVALKNTGADLPDDRVQDLLDTWEAARATRVTAYLSAAVDLDKLSWNAAELQLVDARNQAALELARLLNLDPVWIGQAPGGNGSSVLYQNRVDLYQQLVDLSLRPLISAVEQRLSAWDVTPRGHEVRFDLSAFLRGNPEQRANLVATLLPLGVLTVEEARALMEYAPRPEGGSR